MLRLSYRSYSVPTVDTHVLRMKLRSTPLGKSALEEGGGGLEGVQHPLKFVLKLL